MAAKSVDNSRPCELDVSHSGSPSDRNAAPALPMRSINSSNSLVDRPALRPRGERRVYASLRGMGAAAAGDDAAFAFVIYQRPGS